jgi:hypothetical protein
MTEINMRRITDSPTDQDLDALGKINKACDICGGPNGDIWLHCDSWTKWMRFGCGCNVHHCNTPECSAGAKLKSQVLRDENRVKAEESERKMLLNISSGQLARLRSRYLKDFNCSEDFRDWVQGVVGEERMREFLDVSCACCGKQLGPVKYKFEDKDGKCRLATLDEIESYCYSVLGRDPLTEPFYYKWDINSDFRVGVPNEDEPEIAFKSDIWDYFEKKGGGHNCQDFPSFHEAYKVVNVENNEWSGCCFIYHMPTRTCLGRMIQRGGDWPQVVMLNQKQLNDEKDELRKQMGDEYFKNPGFFPACHDIDKKQEWAYYCSKACCEKSTTEQATIFI